jgi:hypothetical protein
MLKFNTEKDHDIIDARRSIQMQQGDYFMVGSVFN